MKRIISRICTLLLSVLVTSVLLFSPATILAMTYTFTSIDYPESGTKETRAHRINDANQVTGRYMDTSNYWHGFLYSGGSFTTFGNYPGAQNSYPFGINNSGQFVGYYWNPPDNFYHGFLFDGTNFIAISYPGAQNTSITGINDSVKIVGSYWPGSSPVPGPGSKGFLYIGGNFTQIAHPDPNDRLTSSLDINNSDQIVGYYQDINYKYHGFIVRYSGGSIDWGNASYLNYPGATNTEAMGINHAGQLVGTYWSAPDNLSHGFFYSNGEFSQVDYPNSKITIPYGINNSGQIVGRYQDGSGNIHGFLATPIPEPGTILLIGSGLLGLAGLRRKFKK